MIKEACYQLGHISKLHGLSGELTAFFDVDYPEEYENLESVFVEINNKLVPFFIESLEITPKKVILKFEDVGSVEAAEELTGKDLYLPLTALPSLTGKAFYYHEIIGFTAIDASFGEIGPIKEVYTNSSQDLVACEHKGQEILIPVSDELIERIDREKKELHFNLPEGLIQLYLED
jgi:16S rRNA processing protein RimM